MDIVHLHRGFFSANLSLLAPTGAFWVELKLEFKWLVIIISKSKFFSQRNSWKNHPYCINLSLKLYPRSCLMKVKIGDVCQNSPLIHRHPEWSQAWSVSCKSRCWGESCPRCMIVHRGNYVKSSMRGREQGEYHAQYSWQHQLETGYLAFACYNRM